MVITFREGWGLVQNIITQEAPPYSIIKNELTILMRLFR